MPTDSPASPAQMPSLSIIIPIYQVEAYIEECLGSIIHQGVVAQLILVDDCGPDKSMAVAEAFLSQSDCPEGITWLSLRHERNRGLSAARNSGMEVARGDYILFVDSDDKLVEGALPALLSAAQASQADVIMGSVETTAGRLTRHFEREQLLTGLEARHLFLQRKLPQMAWGKLLSRRFLESKQMQFLEGLIHEDELWSMELFLHQARTHIIPDCVYWYRQDREGSIMNEAHLEAMLRRDIHKMRIIHRFVDLGLEHHLMQDAIFDDAIASWEALMLRENPQIQSLNFCRQYRYFWHYLKHMHPAWAAKHLACDLKGQKANLRVRASFLKRVARIKRYYPRFVGALLLLLNAKGKKYGRNIR